MSASVPYPSKHRYPANTYPAEPVTPAAATSEGEAGERLAWWLALGAAVSGLLLGIVIIAWPEATLRVVATLFGVWLVTHGVIRVVQSITGSVAEGAERAILGAIGIFFVAAGVIALRNLLASITLMITLLGLMWLIGGILQFVTAFGAHGALRWWNAAIGALSIVAALVVFAWPSPSLTIIVYVTGAWMIVMGLVQIAMVFWARRSIGEAPVPQVPPAPQVPPIGAES